MKIPIAMPSGWSLGDAQAREPGSRARPTAKVGAPRRPRAAALPRRRAAGLTPTVSRAPPERVPHRGALESARAGDSPAAQSLSAAALAVGGAGAMHDGSAAQAKERSAGVTGAAAHEALGVHAPSFGSFPKYLVRRS